MGGAEGAGPLPGDGGHRKNKDEDELVHGGDRGGIRKVIK